MTGAVIIQASQNSKIGFEAFGAAREFWAYKGPECVIAGPYETGKTMPMLQKLNALLAKYAGARALLVRKTYKSLINSAVVTFEHKVLPFAPGHPRCAVKKYGKSRPEWYDYPNGSRLVLGGMDNPAKTLSSEYDFIAVPQAEELTEDEHQALTRACTGRAGNSPYTQIMLDCNPGPPGHWILKRDRLKKFYSKHKDNPTLWNREREEWTEQGQRTMETLQAMTGTRYKRGYLGQWVAAEGQVYEFDPAVHLIYAHECPKFISRYRSIDFGYTNPFVCQWWGEDSDGRLYLYRELYMSQRTVRQHAEKINKLSRKEQYRVTVADHDAEDRATLREHGIRSKPADKRVSVGIDKVQERLKIHGDGKPRLYIVRDCLVETDRYLEEEHKPTSTEDEFPGYVWPTVRANRAADEKPVKVDDHGMDALRYMVMYFDGKIRRESRIY